MSIVYCLPIPKHFYTPRADGKTKCLCCISREMLEEAYKEPEMHKNLVVRVGGYSEYFYVLSDELKRMIINRTIQEDI